MPITSLPYDITTQIIHALEQSAFQTYSPLDRLRALGAYSLISPGIWLKSARERYWSNLEIPYDSTKRFKDMTELFSHPFSTFRLVKIRSLHYGAAWIWKSHPHCTRPEDRTPVKFLEWCGSFVDEARGLTVADKYFGHLQSLNFRNVSILDDPQSPLVFSRILASNHPRPFPLSPKAKSVLLNSFQTVTQLSFRTKVVFSSEEQFAEILASFPALERSTNHQVEFLTPASHVYLPIPVERRGPSRLRQFEWFLRPGDVNDNLFAVITDIFSLSIAPRQSLFLHETYVSGCEGNPSILHHYDHHPLTSHRGFLSKLPSLYSLTISMNQSDFQTQYLHELLSFSEPHPTLSSLEIQDFAKYQRRAEIDNAIRTFVPRLESIHFLLNAVMPTLSSRDQSEDFRRLYQMKEQDAFDRFSESMPYCRAQGLLCPEYRFEFDEFDEGVTVEDWDVNV